MQQQLSQKAISKISGNDDLKLAIAKVTGRSFRTVEKWLRENDPLLTLASVLSVIKSSTGLTESEILESEVKATA